MNIVERLVAETSRNMNRATDHHLVMAQIEEKMKPYPKPVSKKKKAKNPPIDKAAILLKRYGETARTSECDCGCGQDGHDLHHCFIRRRKGYPILDDERNLVFVNADEHRPPVNKFNSVEWKRIFWFVQCGRYGTAAMQEWVDAVIASGLDKSRIDWL